MFQDVLEVSRTVSGPRHPHTITTMSNLAGCLNRQRKYREAQEIIEEAIFAIFPREIWIQIVQEPQPQGYTVPGLPMLSMPEGKRGSNTDFRHSWRAKSHACQLALELGRPELH
jgi:hypothetical protein